MFNQMVTKMAYPTKFGCTSFPSCSVPSWPFYAAHSGPGQLQNILFSFHFWNYCLSIIAMVFIFFLPDSIKGKMCPPIPTPMLTEKWPRRAVGFLNWASRSFSVFLSRWTKILRDLWVKWKLKRLSAPLLNIFLGLNPQILTQNPSVQTVYCFTVLFHFILILINN